MDANGGYFQTFLKKQGFLGGVEPAPPAPAPPAPAPRAAAPRGSAVGPPGAGLACDAKEALCVDSSAALAAGLLAPWRSSRGATTKATDKTVRDLRRAFHALGFRAVRARETAAGTVVSAESPAGDQFEFLAGAAQVNFRVRAARTFLSSEGGSVQRAQGVLRRLRDLLFRQYGWGSA